MNDDRGSRWRKWDLHVHTPESFHNDFGFSGEDETERYGGDPWEKYLEELESVSGIDALGITDYMSLDGYERIVEERENGRLDNFELVLPNIEFRLDDIVSRKDGTDKRINMHVLFDNNLDVDIIREKFLHSITFETPDGDLERLTKTHIEELGRKHNQKTPGKSSESDLQAGFKIVTVPFNNILDTLENSTFSGKYLIVLALDGWDDIDWDTQGHGTKERLFREADALFSSNEKQIRWALGERDGIEQFKRMLGGPTPCIWGSDAHGYERLCQPDEDRFCWIKADLTFQGLKQIIHEPKRRVHIGTEDPYGGPDIYALDEINIQNGVVDERLEIEEGSLSLNRDLVTIIGGKGAGKTALLDLIANSFKDRWDRDKKKGEEPTDQNSFIQRIQDKEPEIETTLRFSGEEVPDFSKVVDEQEFFEASDIVYLPQGKIEEYCRDDERLHDHILELITRSVKRDHRGMVERLEKLRGEADELADDFRSATSDIYQLNPKQLDEQLDKTKTDRNHRKGDLESKKAEIDAFEDQNQEVLEDTNANELRDQLENVQDQITKLKTAEENRVKVSGELEQITSTNETLATLEDDLEILDKEISLPRIQIDSVRSELNETKELLDEEITELQSEEEKIDEELEELGETQQEYSELLDERDEILQDIRELDDSIANIKNKRERVDHLREKRREHFLNYVQKYSQVETQYQTIIDEFAGKPTSELEEITFEPSVKVSDQLFDDIERHLDMRRSNDEDIEKCISHLRDAVTADKEVDRKQRTSNFLNAASELQEKTVSETEPLEYEGAIFGDHLKLVEEIYFRDSHMQNLSLGQKGTVLLKILLFEDDTPLIIDQPEENLDNEFIYDTLVGSFRDAKLDRQVIIATHNANLVVNTDAEQIITAEYNDNTISFRSGSLENPDTRNDVTTILEGGDEAFRRRERRYELSGEGS